MIPTPLRRHAPVREIARLLFVGLMVAGIAEGVLARQEAPAHQATGYDYMVATVDPLATRAAVDVFERGGNAVDAAVAAALTLGVVDGFNSGIGGGCFALIYTADGRLLAIDARETAPAAAHRDMFLVNGQPDAERSQTGPLAVAVPGALAGYAEAVQCAGRMSLADLIRPAAMIAEEGFLLDDAYCERLEDSREGLKTFPGSAAIFFDDDGTLLKPGDTLIQRDLARTYCRIADCGVEYFYCGEFATAVAEWMAANGGLITREDFAGYSLIHRQPLLTTYKGLTIAGFPPPSSGGVHVAQMLNILEALDARTKRPGESSAPLSTHLVAESMKLAFADRAWWLGDPAFAQVPAGLIDKEYARLLSERIDPARSAEVAGYGIPPGADERFFDKHTTHIAAADREGNWVAITTTVNTSFGSKVIVPGTGVILNNQMDDFSIAPGTPNAYGLVGNEANSIEPGKRPLSSMSPTIVFQNGEPVLTVGAAGGPRIITQVLLAIRRHVDEGLSLADALRQPRFHHQWSPGKLYLEKGFDPGVADSLATMGHSIEWTSTAGATQAITRDPVTGQFTGVHEPRVGGLAAGK